MSKSTCFDFEYETIHDAEEILDSIGLDVATFFRMCLKKLNRERSIAFLTSNVGIPTQAGQLEVSSSQVIAEVNNRMIANERQKITPEMRDCIWEIFKSQFEAGEEFSYTYSKHQATTKTGINPGSAQVYFLFLNNIMNGKPNKRIVKYDDLVVYLENIASQFPASYMNNALQSLTDSVPYWLTVPTLNSFGRKVSALIDKYKK